MNNQEYSRRDFISDTTKGVVAASLAGSIAQGTQVSAAETKTDAPKRGQQRLTVKQLQTWESLGYGMFIHFGMSTFVENELPDGSHPASTYAPDKLDVDQWVSVARDAGMKYIVLCAKHVAGHCLWPSKHTDYTVANSGNTTNVFEQFVKSCEKRGVRPGFYYCSWDNHNRFGSVTPSFVDKGASWSAMNTFPKGEELGKPLPAFTTSLYQSFQTAQITELLTEFGPIFETWIDIPGVLGRGYRTFLYEYIAKLQPETCIMMNSGISDGSTYDVAYAWPSDLIAIERRVPPDTGHAKWRTIEGGEYYIPGEVCDPIGKDWFFVPGDTPRPDEELLKQFEDCRARGVNLLLDVPPDKHGLIPDMHVQALNRLRKNARI
ncbi:MAG TPA: alpha-L-fucosidase [bacterium]|nr:alpha-L-fucosidase [bacterium]HPO08996.1 alpha-L-fucosidase [bacterium]HQO33168.1 alpha-L-fucosidase [bacterium]HQP99934.1 alpha-L-fucosidase [bacterium]